MKRFLLVLVGLLIPTPAFAVHLTDFGWNCTGFVRCGDPNDAIVSLTTTVVTGVSAFIVALAVVIFIYGAILMVTSQGEERKEAGKKAIIYASIGLMLALLTGGIISFITDSIYFLGTSSTISSSSSSSSSSSPSP